MQHPTLLSGAWLYYLLEVMPHDGVYRGLLESAMGRPRKTATRPDRVHARRAAQPVMLGDERGMDVCLRQVLGLSNSALGRTIMPAGRPRAFDMEQALDRALEVFWRQGYEGTSLPDLTAAMGINRPSLYAAFGNKEALFRKALERYTEGPAAYGRAALQAPTARAVAEQFLHGAADLLSDPRHPPGCLLVQGALACGTAAAEIRRALVARRTAGQAALLQRFERARAEGDLPAESDPTALTHYLVTVVYGMAVQAASGASRDALHRVVEMALRVWPAGQNTPPSS